MQMTESDKLHSLAAPGTTPDDKRRVQKLAAAWALGQEDPERELREVLEQLGLLGEV
jgi:hypothetical protein